MILTFDHKHVKNLDNARVLERFKDLDFTQGRDWHAFLLVVHEDTLERHSSSGSPF